MRGLLSVPTFSLDDILKCTGGRVLRRASGAARSVSTDSRTLREGDLFIALKGPSFDGHDFIPDVFRRGAWGAVVDAGFRSSEVLSRRGEAPAEKAVIEVDDTARALGDLAACHRASLPVRVIGVTGSNGKTTTKEMAASIASRRWRVHKNRGNLNNLIGLPLTVLDLDESHEVAVLEMGMNRRGEILRLAQIARPEVGVVTNVGPAHLEHLGSISAVAAAKAELLESLNESGTAVINVDDPSAGALLAAVRGLTRTFGLRPGADFRAERIRCGQDKTVFTLVSPAGSADITIFLPGGYNVLNALAAAAAAHALGAGLAEIRDGLEETEAAPMRFALTSYRGGVGIVNDAYNANPASMRAALDSLALIEGAGRRAAVLGDMLELGEAATVSHRQLGARAAAAGLEYLVAVGAHGEEVAAGAVGAGMRKGKVLTAGDSREAAVILKEWLKPGDLILLKGSRAMGLENTIRILEEEGILMAEEK